MSHNKGLKQLTKILIMKIIIRFILLYENAQNIKYVYFCSFIIRSRQEDRLWIYSNTELSYILLLILCQTVMTCQFLLFLIRTPFLTIFRTQDSRGIQKSSYQSSEKVLNILWIVMNFRKSSYQNDIFASLICLSLKKLL